MTSKPVAAPIRMEHYQCEDCWYSCPKSEGGCCNDAAGDECNCPADKVNAYIGRLRQAAEAVLDEWGTPDEDWIRPAFESALDALREAVKG